MKKVALKANASRVSIIAEDDYRVEYSLEEIMREDYIDEQNPEARLKIIPGRGKRQGTEV